MKELLSSPLFFVLMTVAGYQVGLWLRSRTDAHPLAQPVLPAIAAGALAMAVSGVDYQAYRSGTQWISLLLGPATVALAVPLHRQLAQLRGVRALMVVAIPTGALVSVSAGYLLVLWLGGGDELARSMAPKTATTPVAIALAEANGGIGALAAVFAVTIGTVGAVVGPSMLTMARITDRRARGLAMGAVSHGIGASRSLHDDETEGAFAGLSMGLTALAVSILLPLLLVWLA